MMINNPFEIQRDQLEKLDETKAVLFFKKLLHAEARRLKIPTNNINISENTKAPDGGVDATVQSCDISQEDLIKRGFTAYQIKSGDSFKPWQNAQIKNELFGNRDSTQNNLGEMIKDCMDKNGTYILVCFGFDFIDKKKRLSSVAYKQHKSNKTCERMDKSAVCR